MCGNGDHPPYDDDEDETFAVRVRVTRVGPEFPGSTIWLGIGETKEGQKVRFAGDWRPMRDIYDAMEAGEVAMVNLQPWQILGSLEN